MKILTIRRFIPENIDATYGIFIFEKKPFAITLELPDKNNHPDISCIPYGEYICKPYTSEKYHSTWQITNVPNRNLILIHKGNFLSDIKGCVAVAEKFTDINNDGIMDIGESNEGFEEFRKIVDGEKEFKLIIEKAEGWVI